MGKIMKDGIQYGVGGIQKAEGITYDNTDSGMTATNVQGALDELNTGVANLEDNPVILWKSSTRSNISHATGANYWTMNDAFPSRSGYTRKIFGISI